MHHGVKSLELISPSREAFWPDFVVSQSIGKKAILMSQAPDF